jgi:hypothetical protein
MSAPLVPVTIYLGRPEAGVYPPDLRAAQQVAHNVDDHLAIVRRDPTDDTRWLARLPVRGLRRHTMYGWTVAPF